MSRNDGVFYLRVSECSGASICPAVSTRAVKKKIFEYSAKFKINIHIRMQNMLSIEFEVCVRQPYQWRTRCRDDVGVCI